MEVSLNKDGEYSGFSGPKRGGWISFPFITGTMAGLTIAAGGWMTNLIVYLVSEFHVKKIVAVQINSVINGCATLFPIIAAIVADSFVGLFPVISISSLLSLLGILLLTITATIKSLKPTKCEPGSISCASPTSPQLAILYAGLALGSTGVGGTRFTIGTIGGNQFDKPKDQRTFFNWFLFTWNFSLLVCITGIVYVEEGAKSWGLGYGLSIAANLLGLAIFLFGRRFYRMVKPQGSPFMALACVVVAAFKKRKASLSLDSEDYFHGLNGEGSQVVGVIPSNTFRFLNRAALKSIGDTKPDGSLAKPWNLCTVQQVEDFKALIKIFPVLSTAIFLSVPIAIQGSLFIVQALTMDRRLTQHFQIPAGSMVIFQQISICIFVAIIDRFIYPTWQKLKGQSPTHLQRIGIGHVIIILSMVFSALVESKRLSIAHSYQLLEGSIADISALWLVGPLVLIGAGEAFHFPGQVGLYYQEFPASLKSTSTAMVALLIAIAFYLGTAIVNLVSRTTGWLPDDINKGRMDIVYWMLVVIGVVNYGYFLVCSWFYEYKNGDQETDKDASDS